MDSSTRIQMQSEIESEDEERKKEKTFWTSTAACSKNAFLPSANPYRDAVS